MNCSTYNVKIFILFILSFLIIATHAQVSLADDAKCPEYENKNLRSYIDQGQSRPGNSLVFPTKEVTPPDVTQIYIPGTMPVEGHVVNPEWNASTDQVISYARYIVEYLRWQQSRFCKDNAKQTVANWDGPFRIYRNGITMSAPLTLAPAYVSDSVCEGGLDINNMRACNCIQGMDINTEETSSCYNHTPVGLDNRYTSGEVSYEYNGVVHDTTEFIMKLSYETRRGIGACERSHGAWMHPPGYWSEAIPGVSGGKLDFTANPYDSVYNSYMGALDSDIGDVCNCGGIGFALCWPNFSENMKHGSSHTVISVATNYYAEQEGDKLCIYGSTAGFTSFVDCRPLPDPVMQDPPNDSACFMQTSECDFSSSSGKHNLWFLPMTSAVVQCVRASMDAIFMGTRAECGQDGSWENTPFAAMQRNIKRAVLAALSLYIVLIGYKTVLGAYGEKKDVMESIIKVSIVMYLSIGDGWVDYYYGILGSIAHASSLMLDASLSSVGNLDYCIFDESAYDAGWSHLKLWDTIDCKIFYYMGFGHSGTGVSAFSLPAVFGKMITEISVSFGGSIIFFFMYLFVSIILILIIISVVKNYIVAIIAFTLLIFIAPIFIPMFLFGPTKQFFENWKNEVIGYAIYPVLLFALLGLMIHVFDVMVWGSSSSGVIINQFDPSNGKFVVSCFDTDGKIIPEIGCFISHLTDEDKATYGGGAVDTKINLGLLFIALGQLVGFGFLFYTFMEMIPGFVKGLVELNQSLDSVSGGSQNKIGVAVGRATKGVGNVYGKAKGAASAITSAGRSKPGGGSGGTASRGSGVGNVGNPTEASRGGGGSSSSSGWKLEPASGRDHHGDD